MLAQVVGAHDEVRRDEVPTRPQVPLVDEHGPAALQDEAGRPRLGHPGAVEVAGLEGGERDRVLLGQDGDVAGSGLVDLVAVLVEVVAQGDVLRPTGLGGGDPRAAQVLDPRDARSHDQRGAAAGGTGDDADGLALALDEGVDGRVRADVGGVERPGEQRLHGRRAGVERLGAQPGVAELVGEDAGGVAVHRRRVRDVGEVAEPQLGGGRTAGRGDGGGGVLGAPAAGRAASGQDEGGQGEQGQGEPGRAAAVHGRAPGAGGPHQRRDGPGPGGVSDAAGSTGLVEAVRATTDPERVQHEVVGGHGDRLPQPAAIS